LEEGVQMKLCKDCKYFKVDGDWAFGLCTNKKADAWTEKDEGWVCYVSYDKKDCDLFTKRLDSET
jgi:hypothetical protein